MNIFFKKPQKKNAQCDIKLENKYYPTKYNEPLKKDMAIIMVYFNCNESVRLSQNILLVKQYLDNAKIPYYIGELSIDGSPYLFSESDNIFQYKTDDYMFFKENLINLVEERISDEYTKICNLDADIFFDNPNWYSLVSEELDKYEIYQPFYQANWLNIENNTIIMRQKNCVIDNSQGHPGFVWAFTRKWFNVNKLPDYFVIGSGDTGFQEIIVNNNVVANINTGNHTYLIDMIDEYKENIIDINVTIGSADNNINVYHLYHGSIKNRQYVDRHIAIKNTINQFNPVKYSEILDYDANGLRCWKAEYKMTMNNFIKKYMQNRKDDSI